MADQQKTDEQGKYIFVSYSSKDAKIVDDFVAKARELGYDVRYDNDEESAGVLGGQIVPQRIAELIDHCHVFLAFLSATYYESKWCKREIFYVSQVDGVKVIPVSLDESIIEKSIRFVLGGIHIVKWRPLESQDKLIKKLERTTEFQECAEKKTTSTSNTTSKHGLFKRMCGIVRRLWSHLNMKRRIAGFFHLLGVLCVLFLFGFLCFNVIKFGTGPRWSFQETEYKVLTISRGLFSNVIPNYSDEADSAPWADKAASTDIVIIQNGVFLKDITSIGDRAFENFTSMKYIYIPYGVTSIGSHAFSGCAELESVMIPSPISVIAESAFSGCSNLRSVSIPDSVTEIRANAFSGCTELESIVIPSHITAIGDSAFSGCTILKSITIPKSVTEIGVGAFSGCTALESIVIPDSVTKIGENAFSGCTALEAITIPESVTEIADSAFSGCTALKNITIPESVTVIEPEAFSNCTALESITIPGSVTSIKNRAFADCTSLKTIYIHRSRDSVHEGYVTYGSEKAGILYVDSAVYKLLEFDE